MIYKTSQISITTAHSKVALFTFQNKVTFVSNTTLVVVSISVQRAKMLQNCAAFSGGSCAVPSLVPQTGPRTGAR